MELNQQKSLRQIRRGDRVAVLSPSLGLPGLYPYVFELGLERMRNDFGLIPVEYPTTRQMGSTPVDRARDLMTAFADVSISGIFASIGGDDEILVLKHLDADIIQRNPKPFFGFSDNTNLAVYLWKLGIPSYYGGHVMGHFSMDDKIHSFSKCYIEHAFLHDEEVELKASPDFTDLDFDWRDPEQVGKRRPYESNEGWYWDGNGFATGLLWGGCLEVLDWQLAVNKWLPDPKSLEGAILCIETSEEMPSHLSVGRMIRNMGERGFLSNFSGVLVGRPKTQCLDRQPTYEERAEFRKLQRETVVSMIRNYNDTAPIVLNLDFGHTDPYIPLALGNLCTIDGLTKKVLMQF